MIYKNKKTSRNKLILIIVTVLVLAGGTAFALNRNSNQNKDQATPQPAANTSLSGNEAEQVDQNKQRIVKQEEKIKNQPQPPGAKTVTPIITYAGPYGSNVEVGGYVDVLEEGGTCTAVFTLGNARLTKEVKAVAGAKSVDCPVMSLPISQFAPKGLWKVVIAYNSASYIGISAVKHIEVK
jgi:hypothetical protein